MSSPLMYRTAQWWHWWIDELSTLLPSAVRSALLPNVERLYLKPADTEVIISEGDSAFAEDAAAYALPPQTVPDDQAQALRKLVTRSRDIILVLPPSKALVKPISLPLVAESNLREVLGFEMDRQTPFKLDQVYYDHVITGRDTREGMLQVELIVTPRHYLDPLIGSLKELDIHPHQVVVEKHVDETASTINLLPEELRPRKRNSARHLNLALTFIALTLGAIMVALPMVKQAQRIETLESEVQLKMRKAEVIQRIGQDIEQLRESANFLVDKKRATPLTLDIIDELTRLLPDNTWVNNLTIKGKEVQIQGFSTTAATLIPIIDGSQLFMNPRFRSSVISSQDSDEERFHLSMDISPGDQK
jgi:general secretion pathway protein L